MEDRSETQNITDAIAKAMLLSTDPVTAAGSAKISALVLENLDQAEHLARCIAAFTTDDALADEMGEIVDESPVFLISKVAAVHTELDEFKGPNAELEKRIWTLVYAGRRERSRVMQTLERRRVL
jgi:hypothetical protein